MQKSLLPLSLLLILASAVWWLWSTRPQVGTEAKPAATPTAGEPATSPAAASAGAPDGYRLAGVAVGEPQSYAAIELPDGNSHLYRVDSEVPGLGRVAEIAGNTVVIEGEAGNFTLRLRPAATATPDQRRVNGRESSRPRTPRAPADDTAQEPAS